MNSFELLSPDQMTAHQRAAEITSLLATAIVRMHLSGHKATEQPDRDEFLLASSQESALIRTSINMGV